MPSLSVNDIDLHYEVKGNGPPLLLIAGFASDGQSWAPITRTLSERFTLIIPDNRGCGQTALNGAEVTIEAMTADCRALLDRLSIERVDILGHSMGGVIAASLAAQQPDRHAQAHPRREPAVDAGARDLGHRNPRRHARSRPG